MSDHDEYWKQWTADYDRRERKAHRFWFFLSMLPTLAFALAVIAVIAAVMLP